MAGDSPRKSRRGGEGKQPSFSNPDSAAANDNQVQCSSLPIEGQPSQEDRVPYEFLDSATVNGHIVFFNQDTAAYFADINPPPDPAIANASNEVRPLPEMEVPDVCSTGIHGSTPATDAPNDQPNESMDTDNVEGASSARNIAIGDQQQASGDGTRRLPSRQAQGTDGNDSSARNIAIGDQQQASGDGTRRRYDLRPRQANGRVRKPE